MKSCSEPQNRKITGQTNPVKNDKSNETKQQSDLFAGSSSEVVTIYVFEIDTKFSHGIIFCFFFHCISGFCQNLDKIPVMLFS